MGMNAPASDSVFPTRKGLTFEKCGLPPRFAIRSAMTSRNRMILKVKCEMMMAYCVSAIKRYDYRRTNPGLYPMTAKRLPKVRLSLIDYSLAQIDHR